MIWRIICCLAVGYLFGNFQTAYVLGKRKNLDIREIGSGNAGTTNAFRTLGKKAGLITFLGDFIKAIAAVLLMQFILFPNVEYGKLLVLYTGLGVVLGHNYPCWLHFKGGKGIAVTAGVFVVFDPWTIIPGIIVFGAALLFTKYVSLASLLLGMILPIWIAIFGRTSPYFLHMLIIALIFTLSAFYRHRSNIVRLLNGTENKIGHRKEAQASK